MDQLRNKISYDSTPPEPKGGLEAEFQMWGYDFKRLNSVLEVITQLFLSLPHQPEVAMPLAYALKEFYSAIRILFVPPKKDEYDQRFKELFEYVEGELKIYRLWRDRGQDKPLSPELYKRLDAMRDDLMEMRQTCGLGIPAQKKIDKKARLKKVLTGE